MDIKEQSIIDGVLKNAIRERGWMSFFDFMKTALYHPLGYYSKAVNIGKQGADFYTAAQSSVFAQTLAEYITRVWTEYGRPLQFQVVELGAGQGEMAQNICETLQDVFFDDIQFSYCIVETSPKLKAVQQERLLDYSALNIVHWDAPNSSVPTILLANEVLDALPVERVRRGEHDSWEQAGVRLTPQDGFEWDWRPAPADLAELASTWLPIPVNTTAELCTEFPGFFSSCTEFGAPLRALFIDYGIFRDEWENGIRPEGTLRAYSKHRVINPLTSPGSVDLTADVYWDFASNTLERLGFHVVGLTTQGSFLLREGIAKVMESRASASPDTYLELAGAFKQLVLPGGMGERFCVLECER